VLFCFYGIGVTYCIRGDSDAAKGLVGKQGVLGVVSPERIEARSFKPFSREFFLN